MYEVHEEMLHQRHVFLVFWWLKALKNKKRRQRIVSMAHFFSATAILFGFYCWTLIGGTVPFVRCLWTSANRYWQSSYWASAPDKIKWVHNMKIFNNFLITLPANFKLKDDINTINTIIFPKSLVKQCKRYFIITRNFVLHPFFPH